MNKFNFLNPHTRSTRNGSTRAEPERRPGIGKIIVELQLQHPDLPARSLLSKAKTIWQERNRGAK